MKYTYNNITIQPDLNEIHTEVANSVMTDKSIVWAGWDEDIQDLTIDFSGTLSGGDKTILDGIVVAMGAQDLTYSQSSVTNDINLNINNNTNNIAYSILSKFIFRGTLILGIPKKIKIAGYQTATDGTVQIYDVTNSLVIVEKSAITSTIPIIIDLGTLVNLPTGEAVFEIQAKRTGGGAMFVDSLLIEF